MAFHAKDPLRSPSIFEIFDLPLAIPALKARRAKGLVPGENRQIFNLIATYTAAISAIVTDERAVAKQEKVRI